MSYNQDMSSNLGITIKYRMSVFFSDLQLIQNSNQHSVSFTLNRGHAIIVQYDPDEDVDMFQIGRSSESPIDFVVMDTVPGDQRLEMSVVPQSTISRFACRILVERKMPYTARIYAAGFDLEKNIFLGVSAFNSSCLSGVYQHIGQKQ